MEMSEAEMDQLLGHLDKHGLAATSEAWGLTEEEIKDIYPAMELLDSKNDEDSSTVTMTSEDYQKQFAATEEDVANMSLWELLSKGSDVASNVITAKLEELGIPPEAALLVAGVLGKSPKNLAKGTKGMLKGNKGSKVQVNPKEKFDHSKGAKHKVQQKNVNKNKQQVEKKVDAKPMPFQRKAELTTAGTLTGGLLLNRGLNGDRDADGTLKIAPVITPEEESQGNQFGYHKREGQNFWTVNNEDPYWDTHEMGTGDAWSDADAKEVAQEVDWSNWNWFK